jgi:hypothetical protein
VEVHRSARKHGYKDRAIFHAIAHARVVVDLDPEADPPRVLAIGPDPSSNLLEVIWLDLGSGDQLVIHAMALRPVYFTLLTLLTEEEQQ